MTGQTVTRRQVTLNWTYALNQRLQSPVFPENTSNISLPMAEYLPDDKDSFGIFGYFSSVPPGGYLIKRDGLSDIVLAYDESNRAIADTVSQLIGKLLENAEAYGISTDLIGSGDNFGEAIIIYLNSDVSQGVAAGHYLDLDRYFRGENWSAPSEGTLDAAKGKGTNGDYDLIEVRYPTDGLNPLANQYAAVGYFKSIVHELVHRRISSHDYNTLFRNYTSENAASFIEEYSVSRAINDPVYLKTREILAELYEDGVFVIDGATLTKSQYLSQLVEEDRNRLQAVATAADYIRRAVLMDHGFKSNWAGLSISDLQKLMASGVVVLKNGGNPNDKSSYEPKPSFEDRTFGQAYRYLTEQESAGEVAVPLPGDFAATLTAETAAIIVKAMTASKGGEVCGTIVSGADNSACIALREQFQKAQSGASFLPEGLNLIGIDEGRLMLSVGPDGAGASIEAEFWAGTDRLKSFVVDGVEFVGLVDRDTMEAIENAMRIAKRIGDARGEDLGSGQSSIALPISFSKTLDENGAPRTVITVDLGIVYGLSGLNLKISTDRVSRAVKITERTRANGTKYNELEETFGDGTVVVKDNNGIVSIRARNSAVGFDFVDAGSLIGSIIGNRIAGNDELVGVLASATLKTIGSNVGDILNNMLFAGEGQAESLAKIFEGLDVELFNNLLGSGVGAVSSYLSAEIISAVGLNGFAGELANTAVSTVIGQMLLNLTRLGAQIPGAATGELFNLTTGVNLSMVGNAVGSFVGSFLASKVITFESVGGQIGAAIGSSLGVLAASEFLKIGGVLGGPLGAAIGAFVGFILGGVIGSIFGGTPRSGADAAWDPESGKFVVENAYSRKGGSKSAAISMAQAAADIFNVVLEASGGRLINPDAIAGGNYGMRKSDFVYRPISTVDKDAITFRISSKSKDAFSKVLSFGVYTGLSDTEFDIVGGSNYIKRAIYRTLETGGAGADFDVSALVGNISIARSFESYLENADKISTIVGAQPDSLLALEIASNIAKGVELGLNRRHRSDWFGGFGSLMEEAGTSSSLVNFGFNFDASKDRTSRLIGIGNFVLADAIDIAGQTVIESGTTADTIDLRTGKLASQIGYTVNGALRNDIAVTATDFTARTNQALTIAANARSALATVVIQSDAIVEANESFTVALASATGGTLVGAGAKVTIAAAADKAYLQVGRSFADEGTVSDPGYAIFRVSLSKAATGAVTFGLAVAGDRAEAGVDFGSQIQVSANGTTGWTNATALTLAAGTTQYFVRVAVTRDNGTDAQGKPTNVEGNERFTLNATVTAGATYLQNGAGVVKGVGTIIDGTSANPYVWADDLIVHEPASSTVNASIFVARSRTVTGAGTLTYSTADQRVLDIPVAATVDAGGGNDTVHASDLGDNVFGGAGNDILYGGRLDDWLLGGDGDDQLYAGNQAGALGGDGNYLDGGAGSDTLNGREGSDWLEGGDGVDILYGNGGDDILTGGAGTGDQVKGGTGNDDYLLRLGDGADIAEDVDSTALTRESDFNDIIGQFSGAFQTQVNAVYTQAATIGAAGYVTQRAAGLANGTIARDWLGWFTPGVRQGSLDGGEDSITLGTGIGIGDIRLKKSADGHDLIVEVMQADPATGVETFSGTSLTVKKWFTNPFQRVEWLNFADGNKIRIGDITTFIAGSNGNDILIGTAGNDFVYGGAGDDQLFLLAGNDIGSGGSGYDLVAGDAGADIIVGGTESDALMGGAGNDVLSGDDGNDDVVGGLGDDIVAGGRGNDNLVGGGGNDIFKYHRGDGADTVADDFVAAGWVTVWQRPGSGNGAYANGYTVNAAGEIVAPGGAIVRKNVGTAAAPQYQWLGRWDYDSEAQILRYYAEPATGTHVADVDTVGGGDTIEFAAGIGIQDIVLSQSGNDLILNIGDEDQDLVDSSAGADSIRLRDWTLTPNTIEKLAFYSTGILDLSQYTLKAGTAGNDAGLIGVGTQDWITGGDGDDGISGNGGNDILAGNAGLDMLVGGAGDDIIYGGTGDDTLNGGTGADILSGGAGADWASYKDATTAVTVSLANAALNSGEAAGDIFGSVENLLGGLVGDTLIGDEGENILEGGKGNDTLRGSDGDDTYVWNATSTGDHDGADVIEEGGETSSIIYQNGSFASGYSASWNLVDPYYDWDGSQNISLWQFAVFDSNYNIVFNGVSETRRENEGEPAPQTYSSSSWGSWVEGYVVSGGVVTKTAIDIVADAGDDTLELGIGIGLADIDFYTAGNDLVMQYKGQATSQVTIRNQLTVGGKVEYLQFHDGLTANLANIKFYANGAATDDFIFGSESNDTLSGNVGDDVIFGGAGADILNGNDGDDIIEGSAGIDYLHGGANSAAADNPTGWGDTVRYAGSTAAVTIDLQKQVTGVAQIGGDAAGDLLTGFENVTGSEFGDTITGDSGGNRLFGSGGTDTLSGLGGDDVLRGEDGNDTLHGGDGKDDLTGGDGIDILNGNAGDDKLFGGAGTDTLYGGADKDLLAGGDDVDTLNGEAGDDSLSGEAGNDTLNGGDGNDTLAGGAGNDILNGNAGDDIYVLGHNDGADTITDTSGTNIVVLGEGLTEKDIWITRIGNDMRIGVIGGTTAATFKNYFAGGGQLLKLQTANRSLFVGHADIRQMITDMTAVSAATTPAAIPATLTAQVDRLWTEKAAPLAPVTPQTVQIANDRANGFNVDGWPRGADLSRGRNLLNDNGWPMDIDAVPAAATGVTGWENSYADETEWLSTAGPYGQQVVALHAGQTNADDGGGGIHSNQFGIDAGKAYEFTYYFKVDELGKHRVYLGLDMVAVEDAQTGASNGNPYFSYEYPTAAAGYVAGRWYKAVGYVLPQGSSNAALGDYGGIYDTVTGQKIGNMRAYRWTASDASVRTRMFNYYNPEIQGFNTHFYKPEVRELAVSAAMRPGDALDIAKDRLNIVAPLVEGWGNNVAYANDGEARWVQIAGPGGEPIYAMQAGQFDAAVDGGGAASTNVVAIDKTKTYKLSQWVRKSDLSRHSLYSGLVATSAAGAFGKELLTTGANAYSNYSAVFTDDQLRNAGLLADEWVRIDSYIMPAGTALTSQAFGGVYRVDGSRITGLDIPAFRWSAADTNIQAYARFFTYADQTEPGWSTYFGEPQLAIVASGEPYGTAAGADALGTLINAALGVIDPDGDITGYALNPGGMPAKGTVTMVNAATGQVRYTPTAGATGSDQFSVIVSDAAGNKTAVPIKVELSTPGINRAPTIPSAGFAATANENLAVGAIAATLSTTDPDGSAGIDYYFKGSLVSIVGGKYVTFSADNRFRLDRDTGALILNQGTLDRESGATSFQYDIRVADLNSGVNSRSADGKVTVTVGDIDELHTMAAKALTVNYYSKALGPFIPVPDAEGRAIDVRSLMLGDPEGGAMKWSFAGATTSGPFSVDPDGMLHLIGAITSGQTYNLTLRATDALNRSVDAVLTLTVNATDGFVANPALYDPPSGGGGGGGFYYYRPWYEQIPPIVLDRDGDGIELVSFAASTARFDQDGDGTRDRTGWVGADDALLAIDLNGNGLVDDGSEISFQRFVEGAVSDLEGLAHFDTNANGKIDSGDAQFGAFRIWQDANQDGISQASELLTLTAGGITAVGLTATPTGQTPNGSGNTLYALGSYTQADGSTRALGDVFFVFQPTAPNPVDPDDNGAPPISFTAPQFDRKAKKYRIGSIGGNLAVRLRKASGLDPQAGIVPGATMLRFPNTTIGMLGTMVLDLDGNGVKLVSRKDSKASFDMNGDGSRDDTGWAGKRDGMLVVDRNGNGRIDDGSELSFLKENAAARNGFEALGAFDSNRDGRLTASDTRFAELKLWVDANGNGATDSGELQSLADHGIAEIGLARHATNASAKIGSNLQLATGSFRRDNGTTGTVGDASLAFVPGKNRSSLDLSAHANQDQLLARMIQDMSQFGARRDIDDVRNRRVNETWADIFAA